MNQREKEPSYILNHLFGSVDRVLFDPHARDNCCEPYIKLRRRCSELGYRFEGTQDQPLDECRWLLFWDASSIAPEGLLERMVFNLKMRALDGPGRDIFREAKRAGMQDKLVLVMFEPPTVCARNYDLTLHEEFALILTCDPTLVDGRKYHKIYFPSPTGYPEVVPEEWSRKKLLVDISSYKFLSHERELFTQRRNTARFFELNYPDQFDLYGYGWNMSFSQYCYRRLRGSEIQREFYTSYRGPVPNKWDVYPRYKFGMCYENTIDQPGYVTLKIFDCLRAGCVPIYLGAPDIAEYVDKEAFIDRREFTSNEELGKYISTMGKADYERYVEAGSAYLKGPTFTLFLSENFIETIVNVLGLRNNDPRQVMAEGGALDLRHRQFAKPSRW